MLETFFFSKKKQLQNVLRAKARNVDRVKDMSDQEEIPHFKERKKLQRIRMIDEGKN